MKKLKLIKLMVGVSSLGIIGSGSAIVLSQCSKDKSTQITFTSLVANGEANIQDTTQLTLFVSSAITDLTARDIKITANNGATVTVTNVSAFSAGRYRLNIIGNWSQGHIITGFTIVKTGYTFTNNIKTYPVLHKFTTTPIQYSNLVVNGTANIETTTQLNLTISAAVKDLTASDITITANNGATVNITEVSAFSAGVYRFEISGNWKEGDAITGFTIVKTGYTFTNNIKTYPVLHKAA
ncbi:MAG: hypothetical protein LBJ97_01415 [Mycoplasmataceae bacterium]|nr:hypothetical protein [Mycoplasmataceae bacterium]